MDSNETATGNILTARQAVPLLRDFGVRSEFGVWRLARTGVLPAGVVLRLGHKVRFHRERLQIFIDSGGSGVPALAATATGGGVE